MVLQGDCNLPGRAEKGRGFLPKTERKSLILKGLVIARTAVYFSSKIGRKLLMRKGKSRACAASQALMPYRVQVIDFIGG